MKKETQIKIIETAINGVIKGLFGKLNDGPNFDLLENYKTENFFPGTKEFLKEPTENSVWQLGYANVDLTPKDYIVKRIEGEYAILENIDDKNEIYIALALLPVGTDINTRLHYENLEYEIC